MIVRPETGMLGGMTAFPSAGWTPQDPPADPAAPLVAAPFDADWRLLDDSVEHVFTHFCADHEGRGGADRRQGRRTRAGNVSARQACRH